MHKLEDIISAYAAADEERRLSMYLIHRDLRTHFTAIETAEIKARKKAVAKGANQTANDRSSFGFACNCLGWLKQCCSGR